MKATTLLLIATIFVGGCVGGGQTQQGETSAEPGTVHVTSSGFSPNQVRIAVGDTVTWINDDTANHWVASARHPIHDAYPGAAYDEPGTFGGTRSCAAEGQPKTGAFDSCKEIAPGESYSFTFTQAGTWFYHDHLNPTLFGSVVVE